MPQPNHPAAQDWLLTEAKQGWAGQYLDGRPLLKTKLLLEEVFKRSAGGAHSVFCVGLMPQYSDGDTILSKSTVFRMRC